MAIDTSTKKLGVMEWCQVWEPGLPLSPGTLGQDDQQQLLWGYPGVLWDELTLPGTLGDLTTLFRGYVDALHDTAIVASDTDTLVFNDLDTVIAAYPTDDDTDDYNTLYAKYLS